VEETTRRGGVAQTRGAVAGLRFSRSCPVLAGAGARCFAMESLPVSCGLRQLPRPLLGGGGRRWRRGVVAAGGGSRVRNGTARLRLDCSSIFPSMFSRI
jgi:hypothetical protein